MSKSSRDKEEKKPIASAELMKMGELLKPGLSLYDECAGLTDSFVALHNFSVSQLRIIDLEQKGELFADQLTIKKVTTFCLSPDNQRLAFVDADGVQTMLIRDVVAAKSQKEFKQIEKTVCRFEHTFNGIASPGFGKSFIGDNTHIALWFHFGVGRGARVIMSVVDVLSGKIFDLSSVIPSMKSVCPYGNNRFIAVRGLGGLSICDIQFSDSKMVCSLQKVLVPVSDREFYACAVSPDGRYLAATFKDKRNGFYAIRWALQSDLSLVETGIYPVNSYDHDKIFFTCDNTLVFSSEVGHVCMVEERNGMPHVVFSQRDDCDVFCSLPNGNIFEFDDDNHSFYLYRGNLQRIFLAAFDKLVERTHALQVYSGLTLFSRELSKVVNDYAYDRSGARVKKHSVTDGSDERKILNETLKELLNNPLLQPADREAITVFCEKSAIADKSIAECVAAVSGAADVSPGLKKFLDNLVFLFAPMARKGLSP